MVTGGPKHGVFVEGRQLAVDAETVTTESLVDASSGNSYDVDAAALLSGAGYSSGDFVPLIVNGFGGSASTSSSTYQSYNQSNMRLGVLWDTDIPGDVQGQAKMNLRVDPSSDQIDVRLFGSGDGDVAVERTGITGPAQNIEVGPVDFTPTTTNSVRFFRPEFRNDDNATSVTLQRATIMFGVKL